MLPVSRWLLCALVLAVSVCGCSSLPRSSKTQASAEHSLSGRISVHYKDLGTEHEENLHGRFEWTQTDSPGGQQIELALLDPLGQTVALLTTLETAAESSSTLRLRDGKSYQGSTPEDLSEQVMGWRLPLHGLSSWLNGQAMPGYPVVTEKTADSLLLHQDGWNIHYPGLSNLTGPQRPGRINLDYPGPPVLVELRLIIDERVP